MSRCRRTDELLDVVFSGVGLTRSQADHLGSCSECARTLALAGRFDSELRGVGAELVPEPAASYETPSGPPATIPKGGHGMWRGGLLAATAVAVIALAVVGIQLWRGGTNIGLVQADGVDAEQLAGWLDRSVAVAHDRAQPGGTSLEGWEPARVEVCGDAVVAFFDRAGGVDHGYLWAIGRPSNIIDRSIETGWSRTPSTLDVAVRRAELPVCDVALDDTPGEPGGADLPVAPQVVVRVPDFLWMGDPEDAPIEVEVVGGDPRDPVEVGIARDAYLHAELDDASVRAVDIVTTDRRYRYTVGVPGFIILANVVDDAIRFELLDAEGDIVAAGPVEEWPADAGFERAEEERHRAEQVAIAQVLAEHERRALETEENGARCAEWSALSDLSQLTITEVLVPDLEQARVLQQLPAYASRSDIIAAARSSLDKGCQGSPGARTLADVARGLFGD